MKTSLLAFGACAALLAVRAFAQEAEARGGWVFDNRILRSEAEGALPASVYSGDFLTKSGSPIPLEGLRLEPQNLGGLSLDGSSGARVNLLGLGTQNTLTLINGRRAYGFADLGAIPVGAVDHIEVLKGGSYPAYGSDGTAGVVNVITRGAPGTLPFRGVEIDLLYGFQSSRGAKGGDFQSASILAGWGNDKLSVTVGASYTNRDTLTLRSRTLSTSFGPVAARPVIPREERQSVYGAFNYKVAGSAMEVYGDVLSSESRFGGRDGFTARSTRATAGLRGELPIRSDVIGNVSYDIGTGYDQTRWNRR